MLLFRATHLPSGVSVWSMCTRIASKTARQTVCSRTEIASSSSVSAGYLERGIFVRSSQGNLFEDGAPLWPGTVMLSSNMNFFHSGHHFSTVGMSSKELEMTDGRYALLSSPHLRTSIVLVMRSGIDMSRLSPRPLSLMKPLTMGRLARSSHALVHCSEPSKPAFVMSSSSSLYIASVKTFCTGSSKVPGSEMRRSTSSISVE